MSAVRSHRMMQLLDRAEGLGETLEDVARTWGERLTGEQIEAMAATSAALAKLRAAFDEATPLAVPPIVRVAGWKPHE